MVKGAASVTCIMPCGRLSMMPSLTLRSLTMKISSLVGELSFFNLWTLNVKASQLSVSCIFLDQYMYYVVDDPKLAYLVALWETTKREPMQFVGLYDKTIEGLACTDGSSRGGGSYFEDVDSVTQAECGTKSMFWGAHQ